MPGGTTANLEFVSVRATFPERMSEPDRLILADAQTNGGMLAAVSEKAVSAILKALANAGAPAQVIGQVARLRRGGEPGIDVSGEISSPADRTAVQEKRR